MSTCTSNVQLMSSLLETVSSRVQDTEALTKMRRQKQQNPDHCRWRGSPGFIVELTGIV